MVTLPQLALKTECSCLDGVGQQSHVLTRHAPITLPPVWYSSALSSKNKTRIPKNNAKSVLLYGSETQRVTETHISELQTFLNRVPPQHQKMARNDLQHQLLGQIKSTSHQPGSTEKAEMGAGSATPCARPQTTSQGCRRWNGNTKTKTTRTRVRSRL